MCFELVFEVQVFGNFTCLYIVCMYLHVVKLVSPPLLYTHTHTCTHMHTQTHTCTHRIAEWLKEEPGRKKKLAEEKRKRLAKRRAEPKHYFDDPSYMEQIKSTEESMDDALKQGETKMFVPTRRWFHA